MDQRSARYACLTFWKKRRVADDAESASPHAGEGMAGPPEVAVADGGVGRGRCLARSDATGGLRGSPAPRALPRHGAAARKDGGPGSARGLVTAEAAPGAARGSGEEEISLSMALRSGLARRDEDLISSGVGLGPGEREARAMAARRRCSRVASRFVL